jgi:hypothetical protein
MPIGIGYPDSTGQGFEEDDALRRRTADIPFGSDPITGRAGGPVRTGGFAEGEPPPGTFPRRRFPFPDKRRPRRLPPGDFPGRPREERFDQLGQAGAGQGFLTPFGETTPQRFRNRPDQIGGSGAAAFSEFQEMDPLDVYKQVVDKASLGIRKNDFLDMSPFQQFMLNERAKRKLGIRGRRRGPGRPPKRPRPFPFPRPFPRPRPDAPQPLEQGPGLPYIPRT